MNFKTEATPNFARELKPLVKKYPSLKKELEQLEEQLQHQPTSGISLGKGCYKIRLAIASKNRGKSGGARVITYVLVSMETVYLVSIYDKAEKGDIEQNELNDLIQQIP
jgi:mRNA-degrading endonuclease RelE of RelBE toxin-antitoxin system